MKSQVIHGDHLKVMKGLPSSSGVYQWFLDGVCIYVGESVNINRRINSHEVGRFLTLIGKPTLPKILLCPVEKRKALERSIQQNLSPIGNRLGTKAFKVINVALEMELSPSTAWSKIRQLDDVYFGKLDDLSVYVDSLILSIESFVVARNSGASTGE
jgi:excinuclease UvrABC nuclease subunit